MSFLITRHIWDSSPQGGNAKLVLLALADFANGKGVAWPSIPTVARKTGLSTRQVKRVLPKLEEDGEIHIERSGPGRRRVHRYTFPKYINGDTLSPEPIRTIKKRGSVFPSKDPTKRNPRVKQRLGNGVVL